MKIIFLDIDGVMNSLEYRKQHPEDFGKMYGIDAPKVEILKKIISATNAKIVISSTWRLDQMGLQEIALAGIEFIGKTPHMPLPGGAGSTERGREIHAWLFGMTPPKSHIEKFAIIDDDSDMLPYQMPSFFKTSFEYGLTEEIAQKVIDHFNK